MTDAPVPELPKLTRINSWPKFSPRTSDNGTNLSLSIPATSSSFQGNDFFGRESSKGADSTALTTANTTEQSDSADNESIAAANIDSSLVSTSPFDASISIIVEAQDDVHVPGIADAKLPKDFTLDNDGNAGEEEQQPSIPPMQESDDLSSLDASNDGIEMAMSDDSDDSFTYMMRYCRCIESKSDGANGEGGQVAKGMEGEIASMDTDDNDSLATDSESFTPDLSIYGGKANKTCRGGERASSKQKRPQPAFTSLDVVDIITTPQEEEARTKKNDDKKSGKFTSFDVLGVLFGSCIGCGCVGGGGSV